MSEQVDHSTNPTFRGKISMFLLTISICLMLVSTIIPKWSQLKNKNMNLWIECEDNICETIDDIWTTDYKILYTSIAIISYIFAFAAVPFLLSHVMYHRTRMGIKRKISLISATILVLLSGVLMIISTSFYKTRHDALDYKSGEALHLAMASGIIEIISATYAILEIVTF
ncbi:hypothetical protein A3Q56_03950 [Intoshia linei]|uniref:Uncharacterized protein n=1 Tax=Intoshia linei TaxID=1819745 RepID=A0A177B3H9_9BILA|nr:hypothetical protein A3Q56_03950 [Intoshia linei]